MKLLRNYRVLRMVYFFSDADLEWAVGRRNLCLISNICDANIADRFQVKGDTKGVLHPWMTGQRATVTAERQTNVF